MSKHLDIYKERRARLHKLLALSERDTIVLCAGVEPRHGLFRQESTFYYYTGLEEPGAVLCIEGGGNELLYVPSYEGVRGKWVAHEVVAGSDPAVYGVTEIRYLGKAAGGYSLRPFANDKMYSDLVSYIASRSGKIYSTGTPQWFGAYPEQVLWYLSQHVSSFNQNFIDMSATVGAMRRIKDAHELSCIRTAIERTAAGQAVARSLMQAGRSEGEVRGALEAEFVRLGSRVPAFESIVATGINGTVLHYIDEKSVLADGDLVVVDIGATCANYAADITRTYPVSGTYTARQKELYKIVLDTQAHVASVAKPGMYLNNRNEPEKSLHHIAVAYLDRYGLGGFMPHGIGHFMGLDVHDVGDRSVPLAPGDVITIEPGIYIAAEKIGIRIEDDYLITETGTECLSVAIPKELHDIEGGR